jgi:hypothetical protein
VIRGAGLLALSKENMQSHRQPFVSADQFITEAEARHQITFFSQKMAQNKPKKKMPSMAANAIMHLVKLAAVELHHLRAHCAFC